MNGKQWAIFAGGAAGGFIVNKALLPKVPFVSKYPEVADIATILIGWGLTKVKVTKIAGYGFIAVAVGTLIFDLYKRIPGRSAEEIPGSIPSEGGILLV